MKAVIFDMDGVMFDTEIVFIKAWDYAGEKIGIGKAGHMSLKTLGMNIVMSEKILREEYGDSYDENGLRKYTKEFLKDYYDHNRVPVKKGLYNLLDYLTQNNYKLAVASSSPKWEVEHHLKDANVYDYFSTIVCGDMIEKSKPEPEIYLKTCELLNMLPSECIAIEDSKNGLMSAINAGCKTIMVPDMWQIDDEMKNRVHIILNNLDDVKEYIDKSSDR